MSSTQPTNVQRATTASTEEVTYDKAGHPYTPSSPQSSNTPEKASGQRTQRATLKSTTVAESITITVDNEQEARHRTIEAANRQLTASQ